MRDQAVDTNVSDHFHRNTIALLLAKQREDLRIRHSMVKNSDTGLRVSKPLRQALARLIRRYNQPVCYTAERCRWSMAVMLEEHLYSVANVRVFASYKKIA